MGTRICKAFKFRIYPNSSQQAALAKQFGAVRFVYNYYLSARQEWYEAIGTSLSYYDCQNDLAERLKLEYLWLKEADSQALQLSIRDLDTAYKKFFAGRVDSPN